MGVFSSMDSASQLLCGNLYASSRLANSGDTGVGCSPTVGLLSPSLRPSSSFPPAGGIAGCPLSTPRMVSGYGSWTKVLGSSGYGGTMSKDSTFGHYRTMTVCMQIVYTEKSVCVALKRGRCSCLVELEALGTCMKFLCFILEWPSHSMLTSEVSPR